MYDSLEERMAQYYLDLFPTFVPDRQAPVSEDQQRVFYDGMLALYQLAAKEPLLFVPALHEDDAFPDRFCKTPYGKPELLANQKKFLKTVDAIVQNLFLLGQGQTVRWNQRQKAILTRVGFSETALPEAGCWLATRPGADIVAFSHCLFDAAHLYLPDLYAPLVGESGFRKLTGWLQAQGYRPYHIKHATATDCNMILAYANPLWSEKAPNGSFEYKVQHTGICVRYDPWVRQPCVLGLCIPQGLKPYLERFADMSPSLRAFVTAHTKRCDGCGYCVQTDKTGQRPRACIPVQTQQGSLLLCPYFPGCFFNWTSLDQALVENIIEMLTFMDGFVKPSAPQKGAAPRQ